MIQGRSWLWGSVAAVLVCACFFLDERKLQAPVAPERAATTADIAPDRAGAHRDESRVHRSADPVASLSPDATIDVIQQRLEPLARRRNLKASVELSRAALRCYTTTQDITTLQRRINTEKRDRDPRLKEARDRDAAARIETIRDFRTTHCDTLPRETLESLTRFAAKNAAALGDVDAQMCVIQLRFLESRHELSPDETQHGWDYIAAYEAQAFERGDWRIVSLMVSRTLSLGHGPIFPRLEVASDDPLDYFRAMLLLRRGAVGEYADQLDWELAEFIEKDNPEMRQDGRGLTGLDIAGAKAWAQEQFDSHFATSPQLSEPPIACGELQRSS